MEFLKDTNAILAFGMFMILCGMWDISQSLSSLVKQSEKQTKLLEDIERSISDNLYR